MQRTVGRTGHRRVIGNALFPEYEDVFARVELIATEPITPEDLVALLDAVLGVCQWISVSFPWRPNLRDESNEQLIELAFARNAAWIVTGS